METPPVVYFRLPLGAGRGREPVRRTLTVRDTVPGTRPSVPTESVHSDGIRHRRESCRTEPSLHFGRRSTNACPHASAAGSQAAATSQSVEGDPRRIANPTLRRAWPRDLPGAAICVQDVDVQCVLQFTLIHAAGCALHRHTSRVIHRLELSVTARAATVRSSCREAEEAGERLESPHPVIRENSVRKRRKQSHPGRPLLL